jgi:hypothetical protein
MELDFDFEQNSKVLEFEKMCWKLTLCGIKISRTRVKLACKEPKFLFVKIEIEGFS